MFNRCKWLKLNNELYVKYHDEEWGKPVHDDKKLFEMIILEGAQAGLSWETILKRRNNYREAFEEFNIEKIMLYNNNNINDLIKNEGIIRNKLKIESVVKNAKVFFEIQKEFDSFDNYIWKFVNYKQIDNKFGPNDIIPTKTEISDQISKDLKKRGMSFVGSTIIYAFMQAVGIVNDHTTDCFRYNEIKQYD